MPRNPHKRPCQVPGCKAWARHGEQLCASHLGSRAIGGDATRVLPLLRLTDASAQDSVAPDIAVINEELRQLLAARALFMEWLQALRADEDPERPAVTPTQFLRAWSDSATRVVQLLRARAELRGDGDGALDALLAGVYDELEALLPDPNATEAADGDDHDQQ